MDCDRGLLHCMPGTALM